LGLEGGRDVVHLMGRWYMLMGLRIWREKEKRERERE